VPTYRREDNRNRRFRNTTWNISRRLIITTVILHYLNPLTQQLNKLNTGHEEHKTKREVTHSLYTDDLKLMGKTEEELQKQMQVVRNYSDDIDMEFGHDKCAKTVLKRGKLIRSTKFNTRFQYRYKSLKREKHAST